MDVVPQVSPQTPLDDNVKVPEAIKRRSAAVDAYYADQAKQAQQVPQPTSTPQPEPPATTPSAPAPQAAIVSAPQTLSSPPAVASALGLRRWLQHEICSLGYRTTPLRF